MTNLSKEKRIKIKKILSDLIQEYRDNEKIIGIKEIEQDIIDKKYGLVWEEHYERVDKEIRKKVPVFKEIIEKEISEDLDSKYNFLIEGDNLHSLYLLEKVHKNNVDVILIDPPYNTGNKDFMYDDCYLGKDDDFKHSKWLSFMEKRLRIMKRLLKDTGMIIIHIDENEYAQLKLLCDEVFGSNNYLGEFIWKARSGKGGTNKVIAIQHEYIYCYAKNIEKVNFRQDINIKDKESLELLRQWGQGVYRIDRPTMFFPILYKAGSFDLPTKEECTSIYLDNEFDDNYLEELIKKYEKKGFIVFLPYIENEYGRWRKGYDGVRSLIENKLLVISKDRNGNDVIKKRILSNTITESAIDSLLLDYGSASTGTLQIKELFENKKVFDTTKPVELEKFLLKLGLYNKPDALVLDCFAGSGTTGEAVLKLNTEDGGNRKFILCTNNENNICEKITYEKLKKVILGYDLPIKKDCILFEKKISMSDLKNTDKLFETINSIIEENNDKYRSITTKIVDGKIRVIGKKNELDAVKGIKANLKYYKTDYIEKFSEDKNYYITEEILKHIKEMVQLEHGVKIDNNKYKVIFTDEQVDELEENRGGLADCKVIYMASQVLITLKQQNLFKRLGIEIILIPEYYFSRELREVGELW